MTEITMLLNYYPICVGGALEFQPHVYQLLLVKWLPFLRLRYYTGDKGGIMSTATTFGKTEEFNSEVESFSAYHKRMECFFIANEIPEKRQVAVVLSIISTKNFSSLRDLLSPEKSSSKSIKVLLDTLGKHLETEKLVIVEQFKFYQRIQGNTETVATFVAELKWLASTCHFKANLDESLKDRFVCGLRSTGVQKKLLGKKDLTFESAVDIITAFETVELQAQDMKKHGPVTTEGVKDIEEPLLAISQNCFHCG